MTTVGMYPEMTMRKTSLNETFDGSNKVNFVGFERINFPTLGGGGGNTCLW